MSEPAGRNTMTIQTAVTTDIILYMEAPGCLLEAFLALSKACCRPSQLLPQVDTVAICQRQ